MKKRLSILFIAALSVCVMFGCMLFATGCISSSSKDIKDSVWHIDLNASSGDMIGTSVKDMSVVFSKGWMTIREGGDLTGSYVITSARIETDGTLSVYFYDDRDFYIYPEINGDVLTFDCEKYDDNNKLEKTHFVFYRSGTTPSGNNGGNNGSSVSHFNDIKKAYSNAGYDVNMTTSDLDSATKATLESISALYESLGYGIAYIGKNLNNTLNMELYMLIGTNDKDIADEVVNQLGTIYKYARSGGDVIVSFNFMNTPNFEPFYDAVS